MSNQYRYYDEEHPIGDTSSENYVRMKVYNCNPCIPGDENENCPEELSPAGPNEWHGCTGAPGFMGSTAPTILPVVGGRSSPALVPVPVGGPGMPLPVPVPVPVGSPVLPVGLPGLPGPPGTPIIIEDHWEDDYYRRFRVE